MIYTGQRYPVDSLRIQYPENGQFKQLQYCAVDGLQKLNTFDNQVILLERKKDHIIITIIDMASQHILYCSEDEQFSNHYGWLTCLLDCANDLYYIIANFSADQDGLFCLSNQNQFCAFLELVDESLFQREPDSEQEDFLSSLESLSFELMTPQSANSQAEEVGYNEL